MIVKVKKLHKDAILPVYKTAGAACFDIATDKQAIVGIFPTIFSTGLAFEIPEGHVMLIFSRSGHGFNQGIRLSNCVGVIDSDYRGELKIKLKSDEKVKEFRAGDFIAQGLILPIEQVVFQEVEELSTTERGEKGFGSTDVQ